MTTATLARGPPVGVGMGLSAIDEDGDGLVEGMDEDDSVENAPTSGRGYRGGRQAPQLSRHRRRGNSTGLRIAEDVEQDVESEEGDYNGEAIDFSGGAGGKHGSSDGEGDQEGGTGTDPEQDQDDEGQNGSAQGYEDYHLTERNGMSMSSGGALGYSAGSGKTSSVDSAILGGSNGTSGKGTGKNGKSFVCDICLKTFSNAANMRRHRVRHSGIKPFECRFCQKRFFRKDHMREHMNHKHNNTQMECYFCQQVFDKEKDLFHHVTRDHDVNPRELHCHFCSFSATTLGRFLWHLTTSHPRKNSHYLDNNGEPISMSMAPYALDADYEALEASPAVSAASPTKTLASALARTSQASQHPAYELAHSMGKRDYEPYVKRERERDEVPSPNSSSHLTDQTHSKLNGALTRNNAYYDDNNTNNLSLALSGTGNGSSGTGRGSRAVRYVSLLPSHLLGAANDAIAQNYAEDLSSSHSGSQHDKYEAEDLSGSFSAAFAGRGDNGKLSYDLFTKKMNGASNGNSAAAAAAVAAAAMAAAAARNNANLAAASTGSNRRKSKAPVRMAASPDPSGAQIDSTNGNSAPEGRGIKREYPFDENRNGNDAGHGTGQYSTMLEEVMSHRERDRNQSNAVTSQAEDLSGRFASSVIQQSKRSPNKVPSTTSLAALAAANGNNGLSAALAMAPSSSTNAMSAIPSSTSSQLATSSGPGEPEHKCPHCHIIFPDNVMYLLHKMLHSDRDPYRCAICHVQYPNRYEFFGHVINHPAST